MALPLRGTSSKIGDSETSSRRKSGEKLLTQDTTKGSAREGSPQANEGDPIKAFETCLRKNGQSRPGKAS